MTSQPPNPAILLKKEKRRPLFLMALASVPKGSALSSGLEIDAKCMPTIIYYVNE